MQNSLSAMEEEAKRSGEVNGVGREQRNEHYREILSRHIMSMDYKQSPLVDKALETSSIFQLLTSPAYHLTNLLQPYVISMPVIAGRHGVGRSAHDALGAGRAGYPRRWNWARWLFKNGVDHSSIKDLPRRWCLRRSAHRSRN